MLEEMSLSFIKKSLRKHCLNLELQALFLLGLKFTVDYEDNYLKLNIGDLLIKKVAEEFKNNDKINSPAWSNFVKTGVHKERKPEDVDWWYTRCASIIRRVYMDGPVGVMSLRTFYGGKKDRGVTPEVFRKGSGAIVRNALHQLEDAGYVEKVVGGRVVTPAGRSFLDKISAEIIKDIPNLAKY